jgi:hypothetical protein
VLAKRQGGWPCGTVANRPFAIAFSVSTTPKTCPNTDVPERVYISLGIGLWLTDLGGTIAVAAVAMLKIYESKARAAM